MDTITHALLGVGLAGLAMGNPEISQSSEAQQAILLATCIGSQGPDFDIICRVKSKVSYYNNHRGLSHSLPTLALMSLATGIILNSFFSQAGLGTLFTWTFIASLVHVGMDIFTPYNTRLFKPLSNRSLSWNVMFIIDPFIILVLSTGIFLWGSNNFSPQNIFSFCFILIAVYLLLRVSAYAFLINKLKKLLSREFGSELVKFTLMPQLLPTKWDLIVETNEVIGLGTVNILPLEVSLDTSYSKSTDPLKKELIAKSSALPEIQAFILESKHLFVDIKPHEDGYWIEWIDLSHRIRNKHPYTAIVILNAEQKLVFADFGWRQKKIPSRIKEGIS